MPADFTERKTLANIKRDNKLLSRTLDKVRERLKRMQSNVETVATSLKQQQSKKELAMNKLAARRQLIVEQLNSDIFCMTTEKQTR